MKTSLLGVFFLGATIAACSSTSNPSGQGGEGGEEVTTSTGSEMSSSSSGMGGAGGNGMGGGGGAGGGAPGVKADKLGQVCNAMTPCPMGYTCVQLQAMATSGFCTIPCKGVADMQTCGTPNGFPGPGLGACVVGIQGQMQMYCGVVCGAQYMLPDMCPGGLTCKDTLDAATKMPGMDGKTDFCVP